MGYINPLMAQGYFLSDDHETLGGVYFSYEAPVTRVDVDIVDPPAQTYLPGANSAIPTHYALVDYQTGEILTGGAFQGPLQISYTSQNVCEKRPPMPI